MLKQALCLAAVSSVFCAPAAAMSVSVDVTSISWALTDLRPRDRFDPSYVVDPALTSTQGRTGDTFYTGVPGDEPGESELHFSKGGLTVHDRATPDSMSLRIADSATAPSVWTAWVFAGVTLWQGVLSPRTSITMRAFVDLSVDQGAYEDVSTDGYFSYWTDTGNSDRAFLAQNGSGSKTGWVELTFANTSRDSVNVTLEYWARMNGIGVMPGVPEPTTSLLLLAGLPLSAGLAGRRRRAQA